MEWIETTVGEFCPFSYGKSLPQSKRIEGDYPVYGSNGIVGFHKEPNIKSHGIIIGRKGSVGEIHLSLTPFWAIDTSFYTVKESLPELKFTYYLLKTLGLNAMNSDSAVPGLNRDNAHSVKIKIPKFQSDREKIAEFLSTFDQKITLNTQTNQTLEQIAQGIFKHWFIDFTPVHAKANALAAGASLEQAELATMACLSGKTIAEITALQHTTPEAYHQLQQTAQAFPSEFVESEMGLVPKGWEVTTIGHIADIIKGKSYKSSELEPSDTALVTLKSFQRGGGYRLDGLKEFSGKYKPEQEVYVGELIIAYTDVTQAADIIGKPAMVMGNKKYKHLVISLDVGVVRPKDKDLKYFLYCLAMTENFQQHTKSFCSGTTVLHLGKNAIPSFQFIMPDTQLLKELNKRLEPIFTKININIQENESLSETRDLLLPKLLNGEIEL
ncbi:Predicted nucleotidyltransferases [uncultured Avibacterium sp.]|uniref:Predicted nucleotidyltransferases n=1 Tax=uncultured Avibacterium sp. TaxID=1936169 RepID=A0A486XA85_9PAST|nr:Predicted nucleotidyltransferases [uncultured Avibacterium sp.]